MLLCYLLQFSFFPILAQFCIFESPSNNDFLCALESKFFVVYHLIITAQYYFGLRGKCTKQQIESMTLPLLILSRNNLRFLCLYFRYFKSRSYKRSLVFIKIKLDPNSLTVIYLRLNCCIVRIYVQVTLCLLIYD